MNTRLASCGLASKFQRILLAIAIVLVLCSSLPVGNAQAASSLQYHYAVWCKTGSYQYQFTAAGDYYNQWIYYRLYEYAVQPNGSEVFRRALPSSSQWYMVQAKNVSFASMYGTSFPIQQFSAPKNTFIRVKTEAWFWDNVNNRWIGPISGAVGSHSYYNPYTGQNLNGTYCLVS